MAFEVVVEHLNHLGIVAEVCREIAATWSRRADPGQIDLSRLAHRITSISKIQGSQTADACHARV
jgi:hypothetical protein